MKSVLFLITGFCIALTSCETENTDAQAQTQIDSIVASKTSILENQLRRSNDSIIQAMALARADSMTGKTSSPKKDTLTTAR